MMYAPTALIRKSAVTLLAFAMMLSVLVASFVPAQTVSAASSYKVIGYYPSWGAYGRNYQVSSIDTTKVTHINYAFADICWNGRHGNPDPTSPNTQTWACQDANGNINVPNGTIVLGDPWIDVQKSFPGDKWDEPVRGNIKQLNLLKQANPNLKTIISVGGWSWSNRFSDVAATAATREVFANSAVNFIRTYNFDGVDLDWEYPVGGGLIGNSARPEDKQNYTLLLQTIREKLNAAGTADGKQYLLTIASGASPTYASNTELGQIANAVDWINIMTYDFNGGWQKMSGHNAPLYYDPQATAAGLPNAQTFNVVEGVQGHLNAGVPASKIVLGMPLYGRGMGGCTDAANGQYQQCTGAAQVGTWEKGSFDFYDLEANYINKNGYVRYWNDASKVPYLYNKSNKTYISYDDVESFGYKVSFLKSKGLGGAMIWDLSGDRNKTLQNKLVNDLGGGGTPPDVTPPTAPSNVTVVSKTATSVNLSWTASTDNVGVTGYTVTYGTNTVNVTGASAAITGLSANTAYTFAIAAKDVAGNVSPAATIQVTTDSGSVPDVTPPTAPSNVTVVSKTATSVNLSWTASTDNVGVIGYTVAYGTNTVNVTGASAALTGLSANTAYTFAIAAKDAAGNVSPAATIQVTTDANSGGVCAPAWDAAAVYTGGNRVTYSGKVYEAKWWTKGDRPDQGGDWGVWKLIGPCSSTPALIEPTEQLEATGAAIVGGAGISPAFLSLSSKSALAEPVTAALPADKKVLVGYWHNFDNGSGFIRLRDVSPNFDVINVSFAEPVSGPSGGTIGFTPYNYTVSDFKADVKYLQAQGKKVLISIGGANGQVQLVSEQAKNNFVTSMTNIITTYGFDGLDIDFEGHSLYLNVGDKDFRSPTTPVITNLIAAVRSLHSHFGDSFMVTMAPETFFVQVGHSFYGGNGNGIDSRAGAYLPVIYGLRDVLDWLQVQHYNSGPITALDGTYYNMGDADFHVAMADMVLSGFTVANNPNLVFPALRQDQVVIGLPANVNAGGGYTSVAEVQKAMNYLMKGQSFNGRYKLANPTGYAGVRGLMTWSINWDKFNNFEFSTKHRIYLDSYQTGPDTQPPSMPANLQANGVTSNSVKLVWSASTDNVGVIAYDVYQGGVKTATVTGTTYQAMGLTAATTYSFHVRARDLAGNVSSASQAIQVTTLVDNGDDVIPPTMPGNVQVTAKSATSITLSWTPSTDNVAVVEYLVSYGANTMSVTTPSAMTIGLTPNTLYSFSITAKDQAGNVSPAAAIQVTTDAASGTAAWKAGTAYKTNDEVTYNNAVYVCVQGHTSLQGWEPANVPALWRKK